MMGYLEPQMSLLRCCNGYLELDILVRQQLDKPDRASVETCDALQIAGAEQTRTIDDRGNRRAPNMASPHLARNCPGM